MAEKNIAVDADGVLIDYHSAYARAWERAFGVKPAVKDPLAYWPIDRYDVRWLETNELTHFRRQFDEEFWTTIPPLPMAVEACHDLVAAGYELICVTALDSANLPFRRDCLINAGFPISRVIATGGGAELRSPKAKALEEIKPVAFVDDYLPYFRGIPSNIHAALILREPNGSPNSGEELSIISSQHSNLKAFVDWWLSRGQE